jgi:hypothetical protein
MLPTLTLDITLQSVSKDKELIEIVYILYNTLLISKVAIYSLMQDNSKLLKIFLT